MENAIIKNVETLRAISTEIDQDILSQFKFVYFPGWDKTIEGSQENLIREAARAILADNISPDNGTFVSRKSLSALIHYVADMLEE